MKCSMQTSLRFIVSQYLCLVPLGLMWISIYNFPASRYTNEFHSSSSIENMTNNVTWIMHLTDIHVSKKNGNLQNLSNAIESALGNYYPEQVVITGDMTENISPDADRPFLHQIEADWIQYEDLLKIFTKYGINPIQMAGNHDIFSLNSIDSERNYAKGILYNKTNFNYEHNYLSNKVLIASFNPYNFPSPTLGLLWFLNPTDNKIWQIESAIRSNDITIAASHNPVYMFYPKLSDTFKKMENLRMYLCGHLHPKEPVFFHHGNTLEVIGTPLFRYPNKVGIVTMDNNHFVYHQVTVNQTKALLTYPVPDYQTSSLESFSRFMGFRAISFGGQNLNLSIRGAVEGTLKCDVKLKDQIYLCALSKELQKGHYEIQLVGDWNGSVNFTIGNKISPFVEKVYNVESTTSYIVLHIITCVYCLILVIPFRFSSIKLTNTWFSHIFHCVFHIKTIINHSLLIMRIFLIVAALWGIIMPISLYSSDDTLVMFWAWGTVCGKKADYHFLGSKFSLLYYFFVVLPSIFMTAAVEEAQMDDYIYIVDLVLYIFSFVGIAKAILLLKYQFGKLSAFTSPEFVFIPGIFLIIFVYSILITRKKKKSKGFLLQGHITQMPMEDRLLLHTLTN